MVMSEDLDNTVNLSPYLDTLSNLMVYDHVEEMPVFESRANWTADFINQLSLEGYVFDTKQTKIQVSFVVTDTGQVVGARLIGDDTLSKDAAAKILHATEVLDTWIPGKHNRKNVCVMITMLIHMDYR